MTGRTYEIIRGTVLLAVALGAIGCGLWASLKRSDDPARLLFKWLLTLPMVLGLALWVGPFATSSQAGAFIGVPLAAVGGIALAIIWRHSLADMVAKPFASLYDGGSVEPIPRPAYSTAQSKQKKGLYHEAIVEIRRQLERFPTDVEGQLLLAQIQAEDLRDLPAAELTIDRLCAQPGHAAANIVFALYSLADWHLSISQDREAARRHLQRIIDLYPESEFALGAAHRIAHLATAEMLLSPHERRKFNVAEGVKNLGLLWDREHLKPVEQDPADVAAQLVKHLEQHPLDTEAREKLAILYADHYQRLDMAMDELEQMIEQPNQPGRLVVHWLNLLADLQIRHGADLETVRGTLQRIIDRDPNAAPADVARRRLDLLKLELKAKEKSQAVKLGTYEQNIGLRRDRLPR
jgi:tetratricopeptide (TPR) repeat protein